MHQSIRLNLGCGVNKQIGYMNIDKYDYGKPDLIMDLEVTPWAFKDDEVDEVVLNHTLEHLGKDVNVFFAILKEIYRVCKNEARIKINVPHPRHDHFINDPTHVRIITPELLALFSKKNCLQFKAMGLANSPLALYLDVDFELVTSTTAVERKYIDQIKSGQLTQARLLEMVELYNNVATEYRMVLKVVKN